jgi:hypothetical protein
MTAQDAAPDSKGHLHSFVIAPFLAGGAGFGALCEAAIGRLMSSVPSAATGVVMLSLGAVCLLIVGLILERRPWVILAVAYVIDLLLTMAFMWPIRATAMQNSLALAPYALGTLATLFAGIVLGCLGPWAPVRLGVALVAVDMIVYGIDGVFVPRAAGPIMITRIIVAFAAAIAGALIGQTWREAVDADRRAIGKALAQTFVTVATGVVATLIASHWS